MKLAFRFCGVNLSLRASHNPLETIGVQSYTPYGHMLFVDMDNVSDLSAVVETVKYRLRKQRINSPGIVILRSSVNNDGSSNYHFVDPMCHLNDDDLIKKYIAVAGFRFGYQTHLGMGLLLGKWVLRIGKKGNKESPVIVGVIPGERPKHPLWNPMLNLLCKLKQDLTLLDGDLIVDFTEWMDQVLQSIVPSRDGDIWFDKYSTAIHSQIKDMEKGAEVWS